MDNKNDEIIWRDRKHVMWFPFSFVKYEVRNERLYEQRGLLNTTYDDVLLYKIIDMTMKQSLGQKIYGTGTLYLTTRANNEAQVVLENIKNPRKVKDMLSELIEEIRDRKHIIGKEFYGNDHSESDFDYTNESDSE